MQIAPGSTDRTILVFARDTLTGLGKTGLVAASINGRFTRVETDNDVTITQITDSDLSALTDAHSDGGWFPVDATNAPGLYRYDIPDAAFATGAWEVVITIIDSGSNNFEVGPTRIELRADVVDANVVQWDGDSVYSTNTPGVPTVDVLFWANGDQPVDYNVDGFPMVDVEMWGGTLVPDAHTDGYPIVTIKDGTGTGEINTNAGAVALVDLVTTTTTATNVTTVNGLAANVITAASMAADASGEIADAVWDEDATAHQTGGTFGQAIGDPGADTNTIFKAVVTDATGATVGVDVAAVLDDTGTSGVVVASLAAGSITAAVIATGAIDADAIADNAIDAGAIATGAITSAKFAAGAIDAAAIATDAIDADAVAASAVSEIQSGLATAAALSTVAGYLDTEIAAILEDTGTTLNDKIDVIDGIVDAILLDTGTDGVVVAAASKSGYALSSAGVTAIWAEIMEGAVTAVQMMRGFASALMGKASGLEGTTAVYRDIGDTKARITATVDEDGNRTAVTRDLT